MLQLINSYQQNLNLIERYLDAVGAMDLSWKKQFQLVETEIQSHLTRCGMTEITGCGRSVDYEYHQVMEAIDTHDPQLDSIIAKVYQPGLIHLGKVVVKAQVAAYRFNSCAEPLSRAEG